MTWRVALRNFAIILFIFKLKIESIRNKDRFFFLKLTYSLVIKFRQNANIYQNRKKDRVLVLCSNQKPNEIIKCFVIIRKDSNLILLYFFSFNE